MTQSAIIESQLHLVEQKPVWERLPGESPKWHMRFRRYLAMGSKRNVNAVYEQEQAERAIKSRGKAGETWYNAAKRYQWEARADAWDKEQDNQKAHLLRQIAMRSPFVSRPFRITQLNSAATTLMMELEKGHPPDVFLSMVKALRELMHDIQGEVESWSVPITQECDAAALQALEAKSERQQALQQERDVIAEEEADFAMAQILQRQQWMQEHKERLDKLLAGHL